MKYGSFLERVLQADSHKSFLERVFRSARHGSFLERVFKASRYGSFRSLLSEHFGRVLEDGQWQKVTDATGTGTRKKYFTRIEV